MTLGFPARRDFLRMFAVNMCATDKNFIGTHCCQSQPASCQHTMASGSWQLWGGCDMLYSTGGPKFLPSYIVHIHVAIAFPDMDGIASSLRTLIGQYLCHVTVWQLDCQCYGYVLYSCIGYSQRHFFFVTYLSPQIRHAPICRIIIHRQGMQLSHSWIWFATGIITDSL